MADVKKVPHSFTVKAGPAAAAVGNDIFVIGGEVSLLPEPFVQLGTRSSRVTAVADR